jgi:glycosyltransferase involved in cell wall biosynthesis
VAEILRVNNGEARQPFSAQESLVTVIIPAYNAAATIGPTLASVLAQTHRRLEVIVVDDGSRDNTPELVSQLAERDPRIRLVRCANAGPAAARNTGIGHANGEFIAPIDADDLWHPTKIEKQLAIMQRKGSSVGAVTCWARAIDYRGQILFDLKTFDFRGEVFAPLILWNFVQSGSLLFRRSLAVDFGGYDTSLPRQAPVEDFKFNLDLAERCDFDFIPEFLFGWTMRQGSRSTDTSEMLRSRSLVVDRARAHHPELPAYLFRWASARNDRECSRVYLERRQFLRGMKLTIRAALRDPLGAFHREARRTVIGGILEGLRLKKLGRALRAGGKNESLGDRTSSFLMADPKQHYRAPTPLTPRRLNHVGGLRIARPQIVS